MRYAVVLFRSYKGTFLFFKYLLSVFWLFSIGDIVGFGLRSYSLGSERFVNKLRVRVGGERIEV